MNLIKLQKFKEKYIIQKYLAITIKTFFYKMLFMILMKDEFCISKYTNKI